MDMDIKTESPSPFFRKNKWSETEIMQLLGALKKYGHTDMVNLAKEVPSKTQAQIRMKIQQTMIAAKHVEAVHDNMESPLHNWLESGIFYEDDSVVPEALLYISLFDEHPPIEDCNSVDFRAIYRFLHRLSLGESTEELSPTTETFLFGLLDKIRSIVWPDSKELVLEELRTMDLKPKPRVYSRKMK